MSHNKPAYGLLGYPLGHTMSPPIHERLFELAGRAGAYDYQIFELPAEQLSAHQQALFSCEGFNITIPHKLNIIPLLDRLDETARRYGAVNTVLCRDRDGKSVGYNTDVDGFLRSVEALDCDLSRPVLIAGGGGVARMFAIECALHGAAVTVAVRSIKAETQALKQDILSLAPGAEVSLTTLDRLPEGEFELLINATPVGMYPHPGKSPVPAEYLAGVRTVFDAVYNPADTRLLQDARKMGCRIQGGMAMLVWQAAAAHSIWDGSVYTPEQIQQVTEEMNALMEKRFQQIQEETGEN